jgi:O-antigen ligase
MTFRFPDLSHLGSLGLLTTLALASAASTVSSKSAGLLWLVLVLQGLVAGFVRTRVHPKGVCPTQTTAFMAIPIFLAVATLALMLRTIGMVHWGDLWQERHAEWRILLLALALAVWGGARKNDVVIWTEKWSLYLNWVTHGFAVACLLAWLQVWALGRVNLTTHPIPWAAGLSILSIWLLHSALWRARLSWYKWLWLLGGVCGVLAVLTSQSRGAFGVLAWWALMAIGWVWRGRSVGLSTARAWATLWAVAFALLMSLYVTGLWQRPAAALGQAVAEYQISQHSAVAASETSFGARLYMWQRALPAAQAAPIWGYGQEGRRALIRQWGEEADSELVQSLGHVHNQYLNDMLDNGIWGLASGLTYLFGWGGLAVWLLFRHQPLAGWTMAGVVFMHASASLSNVNFAHNYYPTIMAVVLGLALISTRENHRSDP